MAKTDWGLTDIVKPEDMNNIGQEINGLSSGAGATERAIESINEQLAKKADQYDLLVIVNQIRWGAL